MLLLAISILLSLLYYIGLSQCAEPVMTQMLLK